MMAVVESNLFVFWLPFFSFHPGGQQVALTSYGRGVVVYCACDIDEQRIVVLCCVCSQKDWEHSAENVGGWSCARRHFPYWCEVFMSAHAPPFHISARVQTQTRTRAQLGKNDKRKHEKHRMTHDDSASCTFCLQKLCEHDDHDIRTLPCMHSFGVSCGIDTWIRMNPTCPVCRKPVSEDTLTVMTSTSSVRSRPALPRQDMRAAHARRIPSVKMEDNEESQRRLLEIYSNQVLHDSFRMCLEEGL